MGRGILRLRISASREPLITRSDTQACACSRPAGMITRSYEGWCQWSRAHQVLPGPL